MTKAFQDKVPVIHDSCFIAETAVVIGEVSVEEEGNIWYNTVVRGDVEPIVIGKRTNVQDQCMVHTSSGFPTTLGDDVTIGHGAIIHGCTIESNVLVGMGAIVLDGAHIESNVMVGAGALVAPGKRIPSGVLVMGSPAKVVRDLTEEEISNISKSAAGYVRLSSHHKTK